MRPPVPIPALLFALTVLVAMVGRSATPPAGPVADPRQAGLLEFQAAYGYDTSYLQKLLSDAPGAYDAFADAEGMCVYRKALPLDAHFVARVATVLEEDCGPCTELNLKMAIEAGVDRGLLVTLLKTPVKLPPELLDVRDHARAILGEGEVTPERVARLRARYGDEGVGELAVVVMGSRLYPTLKRALLADQKCVIGELDF